MATQDKLRPSIKEERPGLLQSEIIFHHNNMSVHTARLVNEPLDPNVASRFVRNASNRKRLDLEKALRDQDLCRDMNG
ncbi:hypothetical protein PoB_004988000 [Plakobranchus ocellatus]|uniref:Uncharacterized protein n=1 Tax=Plakobranchus ocellatus TaxID=259542 RepID=A0AAV4BVL6_9GAST|nr:hypothetical protein PoB_004988000 [Plakobranchus ocellatus]